MMHKGYEFDHICIDDAKKAIEKIVRPGAVKDWNGERPPKPPVTLHPATVSWLAALPATVRPMALARQFPRIANRLGELWKRPAQCDAYFRHLTIDERGGRKGFPAEVAQELAALSAHYQTVRPYGHSIWGDILQE
jgi:hypothetical protein